MESTVLFGAQFVTQASSASRAVALQSLPPQLGLFSLLIWSPGYPGLLSGCQGMFISSNTIPSTWSTELASESHCFPQPTFCPVTSVVHLQEGRLEIEDMSVRSPGSKSVDWPWRRTAIITYPCSFSLLLSRLPYHLQKTLCYARAYKQGTRWI